MAGVKISALPSLSAPTLSDLYATVQSGVTYKVNLGQILSLSASNPVCRLASAAALTATYDNGSSGVGATLTNAGALAALSIDGVAVVAADRILVKDQASTFQNGIYSVTTVGDGATAWVLTRVADYDEAGDIEAGDVFNVAFGTVNAKTQWFQTENVSTIGVDAILFESNVVAGTGITKTNNTISLTNPVALNLGGTAKAITAVNGAVVWCDANSFELTAAGSSGQILRSAGAASPTWSTATFEATYGASELLYSNGANTVAGLATANSAVLSTNATGVPSWQAMTDGELLIGNTGAQPSVAGLTAGTGITIGTGSGSITINATGGGLATATIAGTTQNAAVNTQYIALNAGQTTVTLPGTCAVGDIVCLIGSTANAGGWILDAPAGDTIRVLSSTTSAGGTVTSTAQAGECIEVVCDVADTSWVARYFVSTLLTTA